MATSGTGWNQFKAVAAIMVIVLAGIAMVWQYQRVNRRQGYQPAADEVVGVRLGKEITTLAPEGEIVVVAFRAVDQLDPTTAAILRGLERSLPDTKRLRHVSVEEVARALFESTNLGPLLEGGMPPQVFDAIVQENREAAALISLVGLPPRYSNPRYSVNGRPKIGVADVMFFSGDEWMHCLEQDLIDFIILPRLEADLSRGGKGEELFAKNFYFVTKENIQAVATEYQATN